MYWRQMEFQDLILDGVHFFTSFGLWFYTVTHDVFYWTVLLRTVKSEYLCFDQVWMDLKKTVSYLAKCGSPAWTFLKNCRNLVILWHHRYLCLLLKVISNPGFKYHGGSLVFMPHCLCEIYSSDSPMTQYLLIYWRPVWQLMPFSHLLFNHSYETRYFADIFKFPLFFKCGNII